MILTLCTACAAPLPEDGVVQCPACTTRYCSERCERYDRRRGGHGKICGAIESDGGAEQHHANKKYEEAVADAVFECAEDTEGQTCFICMDGDAEEGLVRGCSCRGASGFAHVSCLARQAKILVAEAEERDLDDDAFNARWRRWYTCGLCEQNYHSVVKCALGWACWKTYVGRPEADWARRAAMSVLGNGLDAVGHNADALVVQEAELAMKRRLGVSENAILNTQNNIANTYHELGRIDEALLLRQEVYSGMLKLKGEESRNTILAANNYANGLLALQRYAEAKSLLRKTIPVARRVLSESDALNFRMRKIFAITLYEPPDATHGDLREAVAELEDLEPTARRMLGGAHPLVLAIERNLDESREMFYARGLP